MPVSTNTPNVSCVESPEYELPRLDVPGGHTAPAHPLQPGDGEGEAAARLLVQRLVLGGAEAGDILRSVCSGAVNEPSRSFTVPPPCK